ncbi:MAG TPA: ParB/RepB/Spo0J family partition protein [Caulobacteraceae bacterium]
MTQLSILALQNLPLLRELNRHVRPATVAALAEAAGRDVANTRKSLAKLAEEGFVAMPLLVLTPEGVEQLAAIGRAEHGRDHILPKGWALVAHGHLAPSPDNPRTAMDPAELADLAYSISRRGLLQNLVVSPHPVEAGGYVIRAGARRWAAIEILIARGDWPAERPILCQVREGEGADALVEALVENLQRADLNPMDEAEGYLALHTGGMSFAAIAGEVGERRGKRSIEQYVKVAREASAAQKAAVRDGSAGINQVLRDLQEHKPETPLLQLTARQGLALVEIAHSAMLEPHAVGLEPGYARLWTAPTGGPIASLADKKLINLRVGHDGGVFAKVLAASSEAGAWLKAAGFEANPDIAVHQARVKALGELEAARIPAQGGEGPLRWATDELNRPEHDEDERPGAIQLPPTVAAEPEHPDLVTDARLLMIEIGHKLYDAGVGTPSGCAGAHVGAFRDDPLAKLLIVEKRLLMVIPGPAGKMVAALTPSGIKWFRDEGFEVDAKGVPTVDYSHVEEAQAAVARDIEEGTYYATPWLNDASAPITPAEPAPIAAADAGFITPAEARKALGLKPPGADGEAPLQVTEAEPVIYIEGDKEAQPIVFFDHAPPAPAPEPTHVSDLGRQILALSAETRALAYADKALAHLDGLLAALASRKLTSIELTQGRRYIELARETLAPHLTEEAA